MNKVPEFKIKKNCGFEICEKYVDSEVNVTIREGDYYLYEPEPSNEFCIKILCVIKGKDECFALVISNQYFVRGIYTCNDCPFIPRGLCKYVYSSYKLNCYYAHSIAIYGEKIPKLKGMLLLGI